MLYCFISHILLDYAGMPTCIEVLCLVLKSSLSRVRNRTSFSKREEPHIFSPAFFFLPVLSSEFPHSLAAALVARDFFLPPSS